MSIRWIFFDIGNVIFNDAQGMALIYKRLHEEILKHRNSLTFECLLKEREDLILNHNDGRHHYTLGKKYLGEQGWLKFKTALSEDINNNYFKYNIPIEGIERQIEYLSQFYSLGIAANQVSNSKKALKGIDVLQYFKFLGISEDIGFEKPDTRFFTTILERTSVQPAEAIMIGDRIDFDILPAKKIGMKTIWVNAKHKSYAPKFDYQKLYLASQRVASAQKFQPTTSAQIPDERICSVSNIIDAVQRLNNIH